MSPQVDITQCLMSAPFRIGLGTYQLGRDSFSVCLRALNLGYRHIDTASLYRNEKEVGDAIRQSGLSYDDLFVTTKVSVGDAEAGLISESIGKSMDRLGHIDLILLHGPTVHWNHDWKVLSDQALKFGIRYMGVSNFRETHLAKIDGRLPDLNQIEISPFLPQSKLVDFCRFKQIAVSAHSVLAKGRRLDDFVVNEVADALGVTSAQVMIGWSISNGHVPLVRSRDELHLRQNLEAATLAIPQPFIDRLDQLSDGFATHPQHL